MKNPLISIIVPIYNVEAYLPKCIDSIINQTYKNLEILLIDDGSTDKCPTICDEYKEKDSRIIVIHKSNEGLSNARNIGLDIAKGELIGFVDSDDYISSEMIKELKNNMDKYNSDISACNFYRESNSKISVEVKENITLEFSSTYKEKFINIENKFSPLTYYTWNKLYKKYIFESIRFPEGRIYEYTYILCNLFDRAKKISFTLKPLYYYVYRKNSIGNEFNINHFNKIESHNMKIEYFKEKEYFDLVNKEKNNKSYSIIINLVKMKIYHINNKEVYDKYYKELCDTVNDIKWKESNKYVKRFKIGKKLYLFIRYIEYKVYYLIKRKN